MKENAQLYQRLAAKDIDTVLLNEAIHCAQQGLDIWATPYMDDQPLPQDFLGTLEPLYEQLRLPFNSAACKWSELVPDCADNLKWVPLCYAIANAWVSRQQEPTIT